MILSYLNKSAIGIAAVGCFVGTSCKQQNVPDELPNILWILNEDASAYWMGCYGNSFATTPNIDKLASEGFLYTHCYGMSICGPSRNALITGVHNAASGHEYFGSFFPKSAIVHTYPEYLQQAGYYCTNNSKTNYNALSIKIGDKWDDGVIKIPEIWDESSNKAHYRNRPEGAPFFAVFGRGPSHEGNTHPPMIPIEDLRHDPSELPLAPYHPDTPEMRHGYAQYYDRVEEMDAQVGELLQELEDSGLADNTIVIFCTDHGGTFARSKRYVYETGTHVPLIIRIPEKYKYIYPAKKPGQKIDRLVNFVDFSPTFLSIIGIPIPDFLQGDAFLGAQKTKDPEYTFMTRQRADERYEMMRAVRDKQYRYIRNYMPFRIYLQHHEFLFGAPSAQSWEDAFRAGRTNEVQSRYFRTKPVEELYDTENDPWEINNLADDPAYAGVLEKMRKAMTDWQKEIRDAGVFHETEYDHILSEHNSMFDYMRSPSCPFDELLEAMNLAVLGGPEDVDTYIEYLQDENSAMRYWGATGLIIQKDAAEEAIPALKKTAFDDAGCVATLSAEALYYLGETEIAIGAYLNLLQNTAVYDSTDRNFALNSIDATDLFDPEIAEVLQRIYKERNPDYDSPMVSMDNPDLSPQGRYRFFDVLMSEYLLKKWGEW
ncbi:MAG: sulfatase-like hydrolase/transferase [Bacteroidales bacterium]|nr:sulfatase-like hydrolase/transferase [Bacteroidales bacterium]